MSRASCHPKHVVLSVIWCKGQGYVDRRREAATDIEFRKHATCGFVRTGLLCDILAN
ncbi:MAG: hypothetical protein ABIK07_12185 [Planctomycetota bacterium]